MSNFHSGALRFVVAASTALTLFAASAAGTRGAATSDAQARYQQERAACMSGQSNQDRATCLKEAAAALAEAKKGNLSDGKGQLRDNRMDRCNALTGDEKTDCVARMRGEGTTQGSVAGGGILREKVTIEAVPASGSAAPAK